MSWIEFDPTLRMEIERRYSEWGARQPRLPGQIGGPILGSVIDPFGRMQLHDEFVDELVASGFPIKRVQL